MLAKRFAQMLVDLAEREFDTALYERVCVIVVESLGTDCRNSARLFASIAKSFDRLPQAYRAMTIEKLI